MTTEYSVYNNVINDCVQEGILIECNARLTGVNMQNNTINGAKNAVYEYLNGTGTGKIGNLTAAGITEEFHVDNAPNFELVWIDEDIEDPTEPEPVKNGLDWDDDGEIRCYVDGVITYAGVVQDEEGNYFYINSSYKAIKNCTYGIGAAKTNKLLPASICSALTAR